MFKFTLEKVYEVRNVLFNLQLNIFRQTKLEEF